MIQKRCPHCLQNSYSAYDNPEWICPYCGKNTGFKNHERKEIHSFLSTIDDPKDEGAFVRNKSIGH